MVQPGSACSAFLSNQQPSPAAPAITEASACCPLALPSTCRLWPLQLPGRLLPVLPVPEAGQPSNVPCLRTSPACPPPELALLRQDSKPSHTLFLPSLDPAPSALQGPQGLTWLASESATLLVAQCDKVGTANPRSTVKQDRPESTTSTIFP